MAERSRVRPLAVAAILVILGLGAGYLARQGEIARLQDEASRLREEAENAEAPHYKIGVAYPFGGRLSWWSEDAVPILESAERDLEAFLAECGSKARFSFIVADTNSTGEGALKAVKGLVADGAQVIVGLPTSGEVEGAMAYITQAGVPLISPSSTSSSLSKPDTVFRLSTPENYRAVVGAELAIRLGYESVFVVHRDDDWGRAYADAVSVVFEGRGLSAFKISFHVSHPGYMNYSSTVGELEMMVASRSGALVYLVAWENEDYSIMNEARKSAVLSGVRWFTAAMYPTITDEYTVEGRIRDIRDFALGVGLLAPEQRPLVNDLTRRLMEEARSSLGRYPSYEHVYLYDSVMVAARALMVANSSDPALLAEAIPIVASGYYGAAGCKLLDANGDLAYEDTAFIGVVEDGGSYSLGYYVYHNGARDEFLVLDEPEERSWLFSPQA
jgi:ABC-type branched-subunit amino acid transport system substrate-binding protein